MQMTEISRRALITGATASAATAFFGSVLISPSSLSAQSSPATGASTIGVVDQFAELSAALTGFDVNLLIPGVDPFRFRDAVFDKANNANGKPNDAETLRKLLAKFGEAKKASEKTQGVNLDPIKKLYEDAEKPENKVEYEPMKFLMRSIILAWYLGAWYRPDDLRTNSYAAKNPQHSYYSTRRYSKEVLIPSDVISPTTYTNGLVWRVAQAHPMGYSNLQFGYWGQEPPGLDLFTKPLPLDPPQKSSTPESEKAASK
jgi:hypothetical protein